MPTLVRLLVTLGVLVGLAYGAMYALVLLVEPREGEMSEPIPPERLNLPPPP